MGHKRGFVLAGRRLLIIYHAQRRPIEIVAVTQGARDMPAFLTRWRRH